MPDMTGKIRHSILSGFKFFWLIPVMAFVIAGCSEEEVKPKEALSPYQNEVINYFIDVALGFEIGTASPVTRKWKTGIKIFIGGNKSSEMLNELDRIIVELKGLSNNLSFTITQDSLQSNYYLFLGSASEFVKRFPTAQPHVDTNWGLFYVYFNGSDEIYKAVMYVDTDRANQPTARKHLLREEFTQSLGLARDSDKYPLSIFYGPWSTVTEYAQIDRDVIRLLYHQHMNTGFNENTTREVLKDLVKTLGIGA